MSLATVEIVIELGSDPGLARDLVAGAIYLQDCTLQLGEECDLVVCSARHQILLSARAVYIDEHGGVGLELVGYSSEMKARLAELIAAEPASASASLEMRDDDLAIPIGGGAYELRGDDEACELCASSSDGEASDAGNDEASDAGNGEASDAGTNEASDAGEASDAREATTARRLAGNIHDRLRGLNLAAQIKMATTGELHERIVLERLYGKNVWETLLRNPRLTAPEVSRIARYGSLPRVLLEIILANNAWLQAPEVRRALLSNPRLATDQIIKILRLVPKHELKLASVQTGYPQAVRNAAKMLLRG